MRESSGLFVGAGPRPARAVLWGAKAARPGGRALQSVSQRAGGHTGPPLRRKTDHPHNQDRSPHPPQCAHWGTFPQGKAFGRLIAAPTVHRKPAGVRFKNPPSSVTASPCPPTPFGLRPFPPDRGNRPSPLEGEGYLHRERWLGKLRRGCGTAAVKIFNPPGPLWARKKPHPSTPDFARRKCFAPFRRASLVMGDRG